MMSDLYSAKIIRAGAFLLDTKTLLTFWDTKLSADENMEIIKTKNLLGKASKARTEAIMKAFRQRYLKERGIVQALSTIAKFQPSTNILDHILYFHTIRADRLLCDIVLEILVAKSSTGRLDVNVREIELVLAQWVKEGKTAGNWNDNTLRRTSQGVLATLRDFGILQGSVNKRIAPTYLSLRSFSYIAFYLRQHQKSGVKLLDLVDWKLLFLSREGVERFLLDAHQHGLLEYHVAGSIIRLTFPVETLEEYANVLTQ